jgi:transposase
VDVITAIKRMMLNRKGSAARLVRRSPTSRLPIFAERALAAVSTAISSGWSSAQAEGQICKLKLVALARVRDGAALEPAV